MHNEPRIMSSLGYGNPVNINIEFNINGRRPQEKMTPQGFLKRKITRAEPPEAGRLPVCVCQSSKTSYLLHIDRNNCKEADSHKSVLYEERHRRKSQKRNSVDISLGVNKNVHHYVSKASRCTMHSKKTELRGSYARKKHSKSRFEEDPLKKSNMYTGSVVNVGNYTTGCTMGCPMHSAFTAHSPLPIHPSDKAVRSIMIEPSRTERKSGFQKSLKNFIHKIVNNELSKRSLALIGSSTRVKTTNAHMNASTKRRSRKKTSNRGSKLEGASCLGDIKIVYQLSSLKSIANSLLPSEAEESYDSFYSLLRPPIHIKTELSIDLSEYIGEYQKQVSAKQDEEGQNNLLSLGYTSRIIEHYIQAVKGGRRYQGLHKKNELDENADSNRIRIKYEKFGDHNRTNGLERGEDQLAATIKSSVAFKVTDPTGNNSINAGTPKLVWDLKTYVGTGTVNQPINPLQLRPGLSSGMSHHEDNAKLADLKKQYIQKWNYLLNFVKQNLSSYQTESDAILSEVYAYLQRYKDYLQQDANLMYAPKGIIVDELEGKGLRNEKEGNIRGLSPKRIIRYSAKKHKNDQQKDEYSSDYLKDEDTEDNEYLKRMNWEMIYTALKARQTNLIEKKEREITDLYGKFANKKITWEEFYAERERIDKWTKRETKEIFKVKKNICNGYNDAKAIIDKTYKSRYFEQKSSRMMKCLSETYLKKVKHFEQLPSLPQPRLFQKDDSGEYVSNIDEVENENYSGQSYDSDYHNFFEGYSSSSSRSDRKKHEEDMNAIKERLLEMKKEHLIGEDDNVSSPSISYEEVDRGFYGSDSEEGESPIREELARSGPSLIGKAMGILPQFVSLESRLQCLCPEYKYDIFEFLFLDLCIELKEESCEDDKIMNRINKYVEEAGVLAKKRKGVRTNLNVVKYYLKRFCAYVIRTNSQALSGLNMASGPTTPAILRSIWAYYTKTDIIIASPRIIPRTAFDQFQNNLLGTIYFEEYYDDPTKEEHRVAFLKDVMYTHNRALFDCLNEVLELSRPFGIFGRPFPWKPSSEFNHILNAKQLEEKLLKSSYRVIEFCSYVCGLLVDKEESLLGNSKPSYAYIYGVREDRITRMLANEVMENDFRYIFYDDEEAELLIEVGNGVWILLLDELEKEIPYFNIIYQ